MRQVALISQTMRAAHCHAYMSAGGGNDQAILTSNPAAFADYEFAQPTRVIAASPPPELLPATRLAGSRVFRSALSKTRSGPRFGAWLERTIKGLVRRLRTTARLLPAGPRRETVEIDQQSIRSSPMYLKLEEEHGLITIDRLVVFDVFDLPVALAFAEDRAIEVVVR